MSSETDLELLVAVALEHAQDALAAENGFLPFGAGIEADQPEDMPAVAIVEVEVEQDLDPDAVELLSTVLATFGDERESWRAVAAIADSETDDGESAILVMLQHRDGVGLDIRLPYRAEGDGHVFDEPLADGPSLAIWE